MVGAMLTNTGVLAQGCVSARHISFGSGQFGAEDLKFFQPKEWELS